MARAGPNGLQFMTKRFSLFLSVLAAGCAVPDAPSWDESLQETLRETDRLLIAQEVGEDSQGKSQWDQWEVTDRNLIGEFARAVRFKADRSDLRCAVGADLAVDFFRAEMFLGVLVFKEFGDNVDSAFFLPDAEVGDRRWLTKESTHRLRQWLRRIGNTKIHLRDTEE